MPRSTRRRNEDFDDDFDDDFDERPRRPRRKPQSSGIHPGLIVGGVVALVLFVVIAGAAVWLISGRGAGNNAPAAPRVNATDGPMRPRPDSGMVAGPGINLEINPLIRAEPGAWQRLTPADHPITVFAPGTPGPVDAIKLPNLSARPGLRSRGWETRGVNKYYVLELEWRPSGNETAPDPNDIKSAMMLILGLGGISEPTIKVTIDGLPGQQFEPVKGYGFSGVYVYRSLVIRDRVFIFGVNSRPEDPAVAQFFSSIKVARTADGTPAGPTPPSPVDMPGLVAYLSFDDDPPDGSAMDAVSRRPVGQPVGNVARAAGVRGNALDLSDGKGYFLLTDLAATTAGADKSATISLWFKADAPGGSVYFAGARPKNAAAPFPHLELGLIPRIAKDDRDIALLRWVPDGKSKASEVLVNSRERMAGVWTHYAFTRDAKTGQGTLYVNGIRATLGQGSGMVGTIGGPEALLGGQSPAPPRRGGADPEKQKNRSAFTGLIDELAIFHVALGEDDVRKLAGK